MSATLPMGDGTQTPDEFVRAQSASTGLPEHMCRANMKKNAFVLAQMRNILTSLTRGLSLDVLTTGYGEERGVPISYQAQSPVLGLVLPSNSPGVHTLWLPIIPMQIGLVLKPGPQEPWTPYRMAEAFFAAGIPREAISIYPGAGRRRRGRARQLRAQPDLRRPADGRSLPRQPARAGARPGLLQDPARRRRGGRLGDVPRPDGRERVHQQRPQLHQRSGIWASRHTREIADALAKRLAAIRPLPPEDPEAPLAAFTVPGVADAISQSIDADLQAPGVTDVTAPLPRRAARRPSGEGGLPAADGRPLRVARGRRSRRRSTCSRSSRVVECPEAKMLEAIGPTLVCTAITGKHDALRSQLLDAVHIDRLNFGPVPTTQLNWLQPHEGNIVEFLFRARAFQTAPAGD